MPTSLKNQLLTDLTTFAELDPGALTCEAFPPAPTEGARVSLSVTTTPPQPPSLPWQTCFDYQWTVDGEPLANNESEVSLDTTGLSIGFHNFSVTITIKPQPELEAIITTIFAKSIKATSHRPDAATITEAANNIFGKHSKRPDWPVTCAGRINVQVRPRASGDPVPVTMERAVNLTTDDQALWVAIRNSHQAISFPNYEVFIENILQCLTADWKTLKDLGKCRAGLAGKSPSSSTPFPFVDAFKRLKVATEVFLMACCGVKLDQDLGQFLPDLNLNEESLRFGTNVTLEQLNSLWNNYRQPVTFNSGKTLDTIPYLALIVQERLGEVPLWDGTAPPPRDCYYILTEKLKHPCLMELIWSYWHEEGMLVQTMNAISLRFQNRRLGNRDPLAHLDLDPLRSLNNLIWGYIQDEQHRLTVARRTYEYDHHYGLPLYGKAVPPGRGVDSRSKFLEGFHNLLYVCQFFFNQDDDTTVVADGFPVLNALKDVHILLAEGAHNQFGDLPSTARMEMLMQQWLLGRPEMREFLSSRAMVPYTEPWMDRVDTMKRLQGWTDTSIMHFHRLADFGEQILLSIRFGSWNQVDHPEHAANWARYWRADIQGYTYAYRAVTGVDLTAEVSDSQQRALRYLPPAVLLTRRLAAQVGKR